MLNPLTSLALTGGVILIILGLTNTESWLAVPTCFVGGALLGMYHTLTARKE